MNFVPVTLSNEHLTLEVLPHGLTFHRLFVKSNKDGVTHDILIGPESPQDHLGQKYTNTIIGRYSNRIPVGVHPIERAGYKAEFKATANENEHVSLHGGPVGFDSLLWEKLPSEKSELFTRTELAHLPSDQNAFSLFKLVSPNGDQGYPGNLLVEVLVALTPGEKAEERGSVIVVYRAKLDKDVTPVNLTQHWGFNLESSADKGGDVKNHTLFIQSDHIVKRDELSLAIGFTPTAGDKVHTHNGKKIGDQFPASGYDDYYLFEKTEKPISSRLPGATLDPTLDLVGPIFAAPEAKDKRVSLQSDKSGLGLDFWTNQLGVMFYSNNLTDPSKGAKKVIHGGSGAKGDGYDKGTAAFLEFHNPLTAFLDNANKNGEDGLLTQDEIYHNYVRLLVTAS